MRRLDPEAMNMPWWPKVHFRWKEPRAFVRLQDAKERAAMRWWFPPLMILLTTGLLLLRWYVDAHTPGKDPGSFHAALVRCLLGGPLLVGLMVGITTVCPAYVQMTNAHLVRSRGNHHRRTAYKDLQSFAWRTDRGFTTLVLTERSRDREIVVAVPEEISVGEVSRFLIDRQVQPRSLVDTTA